MRFLEVSDLVRELFPNGFTKDAVETIPPAGKPPAAAGSDQLHLRVQIPSAEKMAEIYRREMSKGGLHLPSPKPAELGDIVRVELVLPYMDNKVIAFDSKVIHRLDPQPGAPVRWGMSVQFLDPAAVHASIKAL